MQGDSTLRLTREIAAACDRRFVSGTPVVYFVQAGDDGPIKIGYCHKLAKVRERMAALQTGCPWPLVVRRIMEAPNKLYTEAEVHERFIAHRLAGEWFANVPEVAAEARAVAVTPTATMVIAAEAFERGRIAAQYEVHAETLEQAAQALERQVLSLRREASTALAEAALLKSTTSHATSHLTLEKAA